MRQSRYRFQLGSIVLILPVHYLALQYIVSVFWGHSNSLFIVFTNGVGSSATDEG